MAAKKPANAARLPRDSATSFNKIRFFMRSQIVLIGTLFGACCLAVQAAADDEIRVLPPGQNSLLYDHLLAEFDRQDMARSEAVKAAVASPETLKARQQRLRADFARLVGKFPERTPLRAQTLGTLVRDGYRIERVVYESRPQHHVTANLYLPAELPKPVPGVLVPCGHSANGKASEAYQSVGILLALNGFAALIYDPIGQGERHQLPEPIGHGTTEHTLVGVGSLLVGRSTGHYRIWDGLRSMDYLAARPEVDPKRLGCTGNSGGGTMTTWLMAVDERIDVAAPSCFITTLERLFKTIGPQDCEQHFPGQGPLGIDHTDLITVRAPKPTLILAAERDFFDFSGTRAAAKEAEVVYRLLGHPERTGLFSYNDEHGFSQSRRQAAVHWMRRWLKEDDQPVAEPPLQLSTDADLQVTSEGQVVRAFAREQTVVDFNCQRAVELREARIDRWTNLSDHERRELIRQTINLPAPAANSDGPEVEFQEVVHAAGQKARKLIIKSVDEFPLPALFFQPSGEAKNHPLVILVDSAGKTAEIGEGKAISRLVGDGCAVLAVDLRGYGESADNQKAGSKYHNESFRTSMLAMHLGQPLLGQRTSDILAVVTAAAALPDVPQAEIRLLAMGRCGPPALHAAVLDERIASLELRNSIRSWEKDVVARPTDPQLLELAVPGGLEHYDLGDLAAMLAGRLKMD
jgi:cephalosporin-C deacetylase-like acetyl esterase